MSTAPANDLVVIKRALISVSDKDGLLEFGRALADYGVEIVSTGGTARALAEAGIPVKEVSDHTGFPEMMDGRVKTLHPAVHGGILALRDNLEHAKAMTDHDIGAIDLVAVNLYPFEATVAKGADFENCIENIDIGGPAMIRSAAKNHAHVAVLTAPGDYASVIEAMAANDGATDCALRQGLAAKAYARTGSYDGAISTWFAGQQGETFPNRLVVAVEKQSDLRYGENPHQAAASQAFQCHAAGAGIGQTTRQQQTQVLLGADRRDGGLIGSGRYDDLGKDLHHGFRRLAIEGAVHGNDAAKGTNWIAA